jgi:hypothetical protein
MDDFLITRPARARLILLPQEYILICKRQKTHTITRGERAGTVEWIEEYDEAAAAILYIIERWTLWKIKAAEGPLSPDKLWIFIPHVMMQEWELLGAFGLTRITRGFDLLLELGFLERRHNPIKKWDRTYQYRFNKAAVQDAVNTLPPFIEIEEWKLRFQTMHPSESTNAFFENDEAIPQISKQISSQNPDPLAQASNDAARAQENAQVLLKQLQDQLTAASQRIAELEAQIQPKRSKAPTIPAAQMNPMKDAIVAAFKWGWDTMTDNEKGQVQQAARQLCLAQATPADISGLYTYCRERFDEFTPSALINHLSNYRKAKGGNGHAKPQTSHGPGTEPVKPRIAPRVLGVDYGDTPTPAAATPAPGGG